MKEELKDLEGRPLFPPRYAETVPIDLTGPEEVAYTAVMDYVDNFHGENATLARSIYGKRAASSLVAAASTIRRREDALRGPASGRTDGPVPEEFVGEGADLPSRSPTTTPGRPAVVAVHAHTSLNAGDHLAAPAGPGRGGHRTRRSAAPRRVATTVASSGSASASVTVTVSPTARPSVGAPCTVPKPAAVNRAGRR